MNIGEILSALTLLLTVVMILFGIWHDEMEKACHLTDHRNPRDNYKNIKTARDILVVKALPLTALSLLSSLAFAPDFLRVMWNSVNSLHSRGIVGHLGLYSSVHTALSLVWFSICGMAGYTVHLSWKIYAKYHKLQGAIKKDGQTP